MGPEFTYEVFVHREKGYIHVIAKGSINLEKLQQMYASVLNHPQYESGMSRLWDFTHLDVSLLTSVNLNSFSLFMKTKGIGMDTTYSAILVSRNLEYGMVRVLQALGKGVLSPNVIVTRSKDEALAWIRKESTDDVIK